MLNRRSWWDRCIFCLGMKLLAVSHSMKIVVVRVQRFTPRQGKNAKHNLLKKHFSSARKHFSFMNGWTGPWRQYFTCSVNGLLCPDVGRTHRTCPAEPGTDLTFFLGKRQSGGKGIMLMAKKKVCKRQIKQSQTTLPWDVLCLTDGGTWWRSLLPRLSRQNPTQSLVLNLSFFFSILLTNFYSQTSKGRNPCSL